jgi:hypothetical protein
VRGVKLERRQLQHVQIRGPAIQQIERRLAQVAAHAHAHAGALGHAAQQRGDGALAIGAGDSHHRRVGGAREQLDVADDVQAARARLHEERIVQRHARRGDHDVGAVEQLHVEAAGARDHGGAERLDALELGRRRATVGDRDTVAAALQMTRHRQAGAPHAHDHRVARRLCRLRHHRSFRVANPAKTRRKLMIQKRTMTLGSVHPLSSK